MNRPVCMFIYFALSLSLNVTGQTSLLTSLEEYYKLDETSGQAIDVVGNINSSSVSATQGSSGKINTCYSFNGTSNKITFGDHSNWTLNTTTNLSISAWINFTTDISGTYGNIFGTYNYYAFQVKKVSSGNYKLFWWAGSSNSESSTFSVTSGAWYHVVITKSGGSEIKFYVNNVLLSTITPTDNDRNPSANYIGGDEGGEYFNGKIDELGIWKRVLTSSEVSQLYNSGNGLSYPFGLSPILISLEEYYQLDETSGQAIDAVGNINSSSLSATQGSSGKINTCYSFNGTSNKITFGDHSNWTINTTTNLSISAWINFTTDISETYGNIFGTYNYYAFQVKKVSSGNYKLFWWAGSSNSESSTFSVTSGTWYHVVITKSGGSEIKFYLNNVLLSTITPTDNDRNPSANYIGGDEGGEYFNGKIDELGIWKRVLTSSEVSQLYNTGNGLSYPFDETEEPYVSFIYDNSGNRTSRRTISLKSATGSSSSSESYITDSTSNKKPYIDKVEDFNILIYPNPFNSELIVNIPGLEESKYATITIYDQNGRLVFTQNKVTANNTLNLSHLSPGSYYINIVIGNGITKWKIVKE